MSIKNSFEKIRDIFMSNKNAIEMSGLDAAENERPVVLKDAQGRLCPLHTIKPVDFARHELVNDRVEAAKVIVRLLEEFKEQTFADVGVFVDLSASEYGVKIGGVKGNLKLVNHDETSRLRIAIADRIVFTEQLQAAKKLFDEIVAENSEGLNDVIKVLIDGVFKVDKAGKIDAKKVFELRKYSINHPKWVLAMKAINDSIKVVGSKSYIQLATRESADDEWQTLNLDLSKV